MQKNSHINSRSSKFPITVPHEALAILKDAAAADGRPLANFLAHHALKAASAGAKS